MWQKVSRLRRKWQRDAGLPGILVVHCRKEQILIVGQYFFSILILPPVTATRTNPTFLFSVLCSGEESIHLRHKLLNKCYIAS
ncbi:hypothetical protein Y032_0447g1616 [Ancylostoma ceylanicum]|uniref:Uncharacterized protein n=1 Tax=Ancylostoma ceylanicum TaxID=53326 RepID=A0A016X007_9BILA|nr:hypothetical protein Y032_0447g1616 [Ancylostoma ceylanicum]